MADPFSKEKRSWIMGRVKSKNTTPEMKVRSLIHRLGFRYRLHRKDLPGNPDIVFPSRNKVIFVHGCFWHGHDCRRGNRIPKSNIDYWKAKIANNKARDLKNLASLKRIGWVPLIIWECEIQNTEELRSTIMRFIGNQV